MISDARIAELVELYKAAREGDDTALIPLAESAMSQYAIAEAALVQMEVHSRLLRGSMNMPSGN